MGSPRKHVFFAESAFERSANAVRQCDIVDRGGNVIFRNDDNGRAFGRNTCGGGDTVGDSCDCREHFFALLGIHGSNGKLQVRFVGNDVVLRASVE